MALDVLRALGSGSASLAAVTAELDAARGADAHYDAAVKRLATELGDPDQLPLRARRIAGQLALCLQAALLLQHAPAAVADAFCASRLGGDWEAVLGTLPPGTPVTQLVDRAAVVPA
jgi:putative acyl-CoA dehydrogenase